MKSITGSQGFADVANCDSVFRFGDKIYHLVIFVATPILADKNSIYSLAFGVEKIKGIMTGNNVLEYIVKITSPCLILTNHTNSALLYHNPLMISGLITLCN